MYSITVLEVRSLKYFTGQSQSFSRAGCYWRFYGKSMSLPCSLQRPRDLWSPPHITPTSSFHCLISYFFLGPSGQPLMWILVITFKAHQIIQDNLPVSRPLSQWHLQSPFCHIRSHSQVLWISIQIFWGSHYLAYYDHCSQNILHRCYLLSVFIW